MREENRQKSENTESWHRPPARQRTQTTQRNPTQSRATPHRKGHVLVAPARWGPMHYLIACIDAGSSWVFLWVIGVRAHPVGTVMVYLKRLKCTDKCTDMYCISYSLLFRNIIHRNTKWQKTQRLRWHFVLLLIITVYMRFSICKDIFLIISFYCMFVC